MSSPARAEGYDKPAQQREDSTTFMVSQPGSDLRCGRSVSRPISAPGSGRFARTSFVSGGPSHRQPGPCLGSPRLTVTAFPAGQASRGREGKKKNHHDYNGEQEPDCCLDRASKLTTLRCHARGESRHCRHVIGCLHRQACRLMKIRTGQSGGGVRLKSFSSSLTSSNPHTTPPPQKESVLAFKLMCACACASAHVRTCVHKNANCVRARTEIEPH